MKLTRASTYALTALAYLARPSMDIPPQRQRADVPVQPHELR
jgi:DNA-binding IscR family transcriptional regulator